jgi:hypothetical protein
MTMPEGEEGVQNSANQEETGRPSNVGSAVCMERNSRTAPIVTAMIDVRRKSARCRLVKMLFGAVRADELEAGMRGG